ncbi:MAG: N-acetylneuraminate synthase family protein [Mycetocola sp.]
MIIDRRTAPLCVFAEDSILVALNKISDNKSGIVFVVDEHGLLHGAFSDGDFRRWVTGGARLDLQAPVGALATSPCVHALLSADPATVGAMFGPGVEVVPLVDARGHLAAVAFQGAQELIIGRHRVGPGNPALVIAEIGNNHQGDVDRAKHLVDLAKDAGADAVKFQLRDMSTLYRKSGADATRGEDLGPQYTMDLLAKYSLGPLDLLAVLDHCREVGMEAFATPWDLPSLRVLSDYGVPALKTASADLTNHVLLRAAADVHLPLLVSTGMSTEDEIVASVGVLRSAGAQFALLQCQSTYPAPFKDVNLRYMDRLASLGDCVVGYSGHERGFHVALAAVARGACVIEKHFTIDKSLEGTDHQVSLLPGEFGQMVSRIREIESAMGSDAARSVSTGELMNRANLAKSLVATRRLEIGDTITHDAVAIKSPGRGLQPNRLDGLIGRTSRRVVETGDFFYGTDLADQVAQGRHFRFRRPWGLPVRYHDAIALTRDNDSNPDFLEFHLSYRDVEVELDRVFPQRFDGLGYAVHCPDLYSGDFIVDLASPDEAVWERSIAEVQKVIGITRDLGRWFDADQPPIVICTMGGFTADGFVDPARRPIMYARIAQALDRIDDADVRLTAQTLPPFPWLMGGQQHHNLFMGLDDTVEFCRQYGRRLTLDLSHSKLAANFSRAPFSSFVEALAPLSDHLHIVDATGTDGEGPQIGDGEIDWPATAAQLDRLAPGVGFIPEIWQGHVNNGAGFWTALERLERWF